MITQTLALVHDAYRELNARRLFWVTLVLSLLAVAAFAAVGIDSRGIVVFGKTFDNGFVNTRWMTPLAFYKKLFVGLGGFWLSWLATILALVSTASIFPDLLTAGSIDLYLSKPISRLRLFLTKYACGLLFMTLQVSVFCAAAFVLIGVRGRAWLPDVFLAVPLVLCLFSYLFSISVLVGVVTRSALAAILLTMIAWFVLFGLSQTESVLLFQKEHERTVAMAGMDRDVRRLENQVDLLARLEPDEADKRASARQQLDEARQRRAAWRNPYDFWHRLFYGIKTVLPKTTDTVAILDYHLVHLGEIKRPPPTTTRNHSPDPDDRRDDRSVRAAAESAERTLRDRSPWWVIGTSLLFETAVLSLAAAVFCRRDY